MHPASGYGSTHRSIKSGAPFGRARGVLAGRWASGDRPDTPRLTALGRATKLAVEARQAATLAAAQAAEVAARETALKAEQEASDAEFAEQTAREAALEAERQAARDARYAARKARKRKGR